MSANGTEKVTIVRPLALLLLAVGVVALAVFAFIHQRKRVCEEVAVSIMYSGEHKPVSEKEILSLIASNGVEIIGTEERAVDIAAIYSALGKNPFIKEVKPMYFAGSTLNIKIELHKLLVHVYPASGNDFFICEDGTILPYSPRVKERLLIAAGNIPELNKQTKSIATAGKTLNSIFNISKLIVADDFFKAQFKQLYVNEEREFELPASVGKHIVLLGDGSNAEEQLEQLKTAYSNGFAFIGPDKYCQLDLRYKNRIIAKKR